MDPDEFQTPSCSVTGVPGSLGSLGSGPAECRSGTARVLAPPAAAASSALRAQGMLRGLRSAAGSPHAPAGSEPLSRPAPRSHLLGPGAGAGGCPGPHASRAPRPRRARCGSGRMTARPATLAQSSAGALDGKVPPPWKPPGDAEGALNR